MAYARSMYGKERIGKDMGWDYTQGASKKDIIRELTSEQTSGDGTPFLTLRYCVRGNVLWCVHRSGVDVRAWIGCYLLGSQRGFGWGYKAMSESEHPYYYSCPLSYLDMVPIACNEWRLHVYGRAETKRRSERRTKTAQVTVQPTLLHELFGGAV